MKSFASLVLLLAVIPAAAQQPPPTDKPSGSSEQGGAERRFDTVGFATIGEGAGHRAIVRGLASGTYAEVTALDGGKTILVIVDDGVSPDLAVLSPSAAAALGVVTRGAVRVRRVTPSPQDIVALRQGQPAGERLASPPSLLTALRNHLPVTSEPAAANTSAPTPSAPAARAEISVAPRTGPKPVATKSTATPTTGRFVVQVATLSNATSAQTLARQLGGSVSASGKFHRVRIGPFADRGAAERARARAVAAGYRDSAIQTN